MNSSESFIKKANIAHNGKYDYSESLYTHSQTKVSIICPIHGVFEQSPQNHVKGHGCRLCGSVTSKVQAKLNGYGLRLNTNTFVDKAKLKHGDRYNYSLVDYKNATTKIKNNLFYPWCL